MSELILRGLMLQDSVSSRYQNSRLSLLDLKDKDGTKESSRNDTVAVTLSRLDQLITTSSNNKKGIVPINLMTQDDILNKPLKVTPKQSSEPKKGTARLSLLDLNESPSTPKSSKPKNNYTEKLSLWPAMENNSVAKNNSTKSNKNNVTLNPLAVSTTNNSVGSSKINAGSQSANIFIATEYNFVDTDYTSEKLELAIEAIDNWNRKVKTLDSMITTPNGQTGVNYKNALINTTENVQKARTEALDARITALKAYQDAVKELPQNHALYKDKFKTMEDKFVQTKAKDESVMVKVKDFLKVSFNYVLDYANPFSY